MAIGDNKDITYFAETDFRNKKVPFGIKSLDRARHFYVVGKTGMGKSTLLENMTIQDINNGNGVGYMDPHGGSAELFLDYIPADRIKDVIYFAPHDLDFPIAFNVMEDVGKDQRHLVANGLMAAFKKIWPDVWSARMEYISMNIILALLEYPGSTLLGVNRMLSDKVYRKKVVDNCTDPVVKSFWVDEFAKYSEKLMVEASSSIQNKFGQFVSNPLIRNIVGQPKSTFDMREVMDGKKIIIMNLSKGRMGELNANLIGGMLITKIYLAAMSRASESAVNIKKLPPFYFFVDEFQSFVNESFKDILSEARKYKLCLTLAHQYIEQVPEEVRDAVFGNVGTTVAFRVGPLDSEMLEKVFAPKFIAEDLVNLGFAQIYLSLMIDGVGSQPFSAKTLGPVPKPAISYREDVIEHSRKTYARPRAEVEDEIKRWHETAVPEDKTSSIRPNSASSNPIPSIQGQGDVTPRINSIPITPKTISTYRTPPPSVNRTNTNSPNITTFNNKINIPAVSRVELPAVSHAELPAVIKNQMPAVNKIMLPAQSSPVRIEVSPEVSVPAKISLSSLTNNSTNKNFDSSQSKIFKPKSTGINMGDLKSAISEAMKSGVNSGNKDRVHIEVPQYAMEKIEIKENGVDKIEKNIDKPEDIEIPQVKEVPEAVLRKILDTETKETNPQKP